MSNRTRKQVLTTGEVARACNVAPRTVAKWIDQGQLRGYRIPGSRDRRVPLDALIRFMREYGIPMDRLPTGPMRIVTWLGVADGAAEAARAVADLSEWELSQAQSAFEAGFLLCLKRPNVFLLDVSVAGDIVALRHFVEQATPNLGSRFVVIDVNASAAPHESERSVPAGADVFLPGPIDPDALLAACR